MARRRKGGLVIAFVLGGLLGGIGGFVVNDLVEKEDPDEVREMCQQYCVQETVDVLFDSLQQRAREGSGR